MIPISVLEAGDALRGPLVAYLPHGQRLTLLQLLRGEEGAGIAQVVLDVLKQIEDTPVTYAQSEVDDPVVHLHYFRGPIDAWITEKDVDGGVDQAFGLQCLTGDVDQAEFGYISIVELTQNNVELDLHWKRKPISEIKKP